MSTEIPDTSKWHPRQEAAETLSSALLRHCSSGESRLRQVLEHETEMAVDSFDSGLPFEAAVRAEIASLLPRRYEVLSGVVLDSRGQSAGQADAVIFNDLWFPKIKPSAPGGGGRPYLPIEGAYAIGEVKQTLSLRSFDAAMEKLVICQRLYRPHTFANRIVENREGGACPHGLTNPLFTFIVAGRLERGLSFEDLINRFFDISKELKRLEVVRALCVPGEGFVTWAFRDPLRCEVRPALFMKDDLFHEIVPLYVPAAQRTSLYGLVHMLHVHLYKSVLAPEDIVPAYGALDDGVKLPKQPDICLKPDPEWRKLLDEPCGTEC